MNIFDLMTLTYRLDLDMLPIDLHAKIKVHMYVHLAVRAVTDTETYLHRGAYTP